MALLAQQMLADVRNDDELVHLQRTALWPLEADLVDAGDRVTISPAELFLVALGCITDASA